MWTKQHTLVLAALAIVVVALIAFGEYARSKSAKQDCDNCYNCCLHESAGSVPVPRPKPIKR
jgi:hypothetical protein